MPGAAIFAPPLHPAATVEVARTAAAGRAAAKEACQVRFGLEPSPPNLVLVTGEDGRDVCWLEGAAGGVGRWWLRDLAGQELLALRQHGSRFLPWFGIYRQGRLAAAVRELPPAGVPRPLAALWTALAGSPRRLRYAIDTGGVHLRVDADPMALEYGVTASGRRVATVSARWFGSVPGGGVSLEVEPGQDAMLLLAATAAIEASWGRLRGGAPHVQARPVPAAIHRRGGVAAPARPRP